MINIITIKIDEEVNNKISFPIKDTILRSLKFVPSEDLVGLSQITVSFTDTHSERILGKYIPTNAMNVSPIIYLYAGNIKKYCPKFTIPFFPFFYKVILQEALFHEIAHHHQYRNHGVKRNQKENHARNYAKKLLLKSFKEYLLFRILAIIFLPINFIKHHLNKKKRTLS